MMYKIVGKLGQGSFGIVYHLQLDNTDEFALKVAETGRTEGELIDSATEARLMLKLSHAHLVQCCASFTSGRHVYLIMELCNHGTLKNYLNSRMQLVPEEQVLVWLGQMADALRYLHACRVIHRDLKTDNIFLDDKRNVKIGDLGIAREMDYTAQRAGTFIGTFCYMSPEVLRNSSYTYKTDIWSLGCCIHEVMTQRVTFAAHSLRDVMENIMKTRIPPMSDVYRKELQTLVVSLLQKKAKSRPDGLEILLAVSKIQGSPFKSEHHVPLDSVNINKKLLCQAVHDFEQRKSVDEALTSCVHSTSSPVDVTLTSSCVNSTASPVGAMERDPVGLHQKQNSTDVQVNHLRENLQPRPLPRPRHVKQAETILPDDVIHKNLKPQRQRRKIKVHRNLLAPELTLSKENGCVQRSPVQENSSDLSPKNEDGSILLSSLSENTSENITDSVSDSFSILSRISLTLQPPETGVKTHKNSDDAVVIASSDLDHSDTESQRRRKPTFGLLEIGETESYSDSEDLVTLYTRAQVVKYKNRKGKSVKTNSGIQLMEEVT